MKSELIGYTAAIYFMPKGDRRRREIHWHREDVQTGVDDVEEKVEGKVAELEARGCTIMRIGRIEQRIAIMPKTLVIVGRDAAGKPDFTQTTNEDDAQRTIIHKFYMRQNVETIAVYLANEQGMQEAARHTRAMYEQDLQGIQDKLSRALDAK